MKTAALIPVKGFRNAKQRLSALLNAEQRERLAAAMFRDVLRAATTARRLQATFVVTGNEQVAEIATGLGAGVLRESAERGETSAVDFARHELKKAGWDAVLIIPGDMPLVSAADLDEVVCQLFESRTPTFALLVPSHDRLGTNALLLAPPDLIKLRFGYDSFTYHMSQVAAENLPLRFVENDHIALDIDEPIDFHRFIAAGSAASEAFLLAREMSTATSLKSNDSGLP